VRVDLLGKHKNILEAYAKGIRARLFRMRIDVPLCGVPALIRCSVLKHKQEQKIPDELNKN
jgi:hypothetical protein